MIYKDIQHTFNIFLKELWFSPHDALIRSHEAYLYSRIKINKPNIDIGCGNGKMTSLLFPSTTFDIGIDNNKLEVILAKNSKKYKRVLLRDATKIPAEDESINTIVSNCTLEHIKRDVVVIAEVGRVLKRGGNFIFTVPNIKFTHEIERNYGKNAFKSINDRLEHVDNKQQKWLQMC